MTETQKTLNQGWSSPSKSKGLGTWRQKGMAISQQNPATT